MSQLPQKIMGYTFGNQQLLCQALTHASYLNEVRDSVGDYQRLEFLGDAVLDLLVAEMVFHTFPLLPEGDLSRIRASLVDQAKLSQLAVAEGLGVHARLGKGMVREGGREKPSILADLFEAVLGAIYLDGGFASVKAVVQRIYQPLLDALVAAPLHCNDAKSSLQERLAAQKMPAPVYSVIDDQGPDHDRLFRVAVMVDGKQIATGSGRSKKTAQQDAARAALVVLEQQG